MAGDIASRDQNNVPSLLGVSSGDGVSTVKLYADPTSHRLLVSSGGAGPTNGYQVPIGTVDGTNQTFTFTAAPNVIVVDNTNVMNKTSADGTSNWTGTTVVVMKVAPTYNIFSIA